LSNQTERRKANHIRISMNRDVQARGRTTCFEHVHLIHNALPEIDMRTVDMSTDFLNHNFAAPVFMGALTGGTKEAMKINATIAEAVEKMALGMGVGSQRAALEDRSLEETFAVVRRKAPTAFIAANVGGAQLVGGYNLREVERAIEMIDADAIVVHLNALQEAVQPEGQTSFEGLVAKIKEISQNVEKPVIVKETGAGIAAEEARRLEEAGVQAIDVSGSGGTSWAAVEYYRARNLKKTLQSRLGHAFWDWGIPTAVSVVEVTETVNIPVIASGGIRSGIDAAKALALGASLTSLSQPVLQVASKSVKDTEEFLTLIIEELRTVMFVVGARSIQDLQKVPLVLTGRMAEWLRVRGFEIDKFAQRGRNIEC